MTPAALASPPGPSGSPGRSGDRRMAVRDPDLVGFGAAIALLAALLIGSTFALYRPAADDLWPFALAAFAFGAALVAAGWSGTPRRGR